MKIFLLKAVIFTALMTVFNMASGCDMKSNRNLDIKEISLIKLISRPENYDKACISVSGVFASHEDEPSLYLDMVSFEQVHVQNSFIISDAQMPHLPRVDGSYVNIIGTFKMLDPLSDPSGVLTNIAVVKRAGEVIWESKK